MADREYRIRVKIDSTKAKQGAAEVETSLDKIASRAKVAAIAAGSMAAAFAAAGMAAFARESIQAAISLERIDNTLRAATGSSQLAGEAYRFVREEAVRLGLDLQSSAEQFGKLAASARGTALEGKAARDIFTAVAEASTVMGLSADETAGALNAIQQMISKGTVSAEELRGQLGERLPGAFQAAARAIGVTTEELDKMLSTGRLSAEDLLPALAAELRRTFGAEVDTAARGTQAEFNRLNTAVFELKTAFGSALAPAIGDVAGALSALAQDESAIATLEMLGWAIAQFITAHLQMLQRAGDLAGAIRDFVTPAEDAKDATLKWGAALVNAVPALDRIATLSALAAGRIREVAAAQEEAAVAAEKTARAAAKPEAFPRALFEYNVKLRERVFEERQVAEALREAELAQRLAAAAAAIHAERIADLVARERELATELGQINALLTTQRDLWATLEERDIGPLPVPPELTIKTDAEFDKASLEAGEAAGEAFYADMKAIHENYLQGLQSSFADAFHEIFTTGKLDWEKFFVAIADVGARILSEAISAELTKVFSNAGGGGGAGGMGALFGNNATGWLTSAAFVGAAVASANNAAYAAAGAAIGAAVGFAIGNVAGAQIGAVIGSWLGSMIKTGSPEFYGAITAELGRVSVGKSLLGGGADTIARAFAEDLQDTLDRILDTIGGTLVSIASGVDLKMKDGKLSVFLGGMEYRFKEEIEEGISFAIVELLKRADIDGISDTMRKILASTTANTLDDLQAAFDFGEWYERLRLGDVAADLEKTLDEFGAAIRRAFEYGLDLAPILGWLDRNMEQYRNGILGIVETEEERIRRQAEQFNAWVKMTEAENLAKEADLIVKQAMLQAEVASLRASLEAEGLLLEGRLELREAWLDVESATVSAEWELLGAKLAALAAVEQALAIVQGILASLPDLISDKDIQDALKRARKGGGGNDAERRAEGRDAIRDEMAGWGLSDVAAALRDAGQFVEEFEERVKDLAFTAEEKAAALKRAQEEEDRLIGEAQDGVRQRYYDAIAQAQGLSEAWGILDKFRDLRQELLDAGLSAEELAEKMAGVDWAEDVEIQRMTHGIVDRLFGYLAEDEAWAEKSLEFARMKVELEFAVMKSQLQLLGTFAEYAELFDAALAAALAALADVDLDPPDTNSRNIRNNFQDAADAAARIAESFQRAKGEVAEFLNAMLTGQFGGVSPTGGVNAALAQFDEVLQQALGGNIGAIEGFDDYASTLLRLARDAYGSSPEFQALYDYVLAAGADVLALQTGHEGNLVFDERFYQGQQQQTDQQIETNRLLAEIARRLSSGGGAIVSGSVGA